MKFKVGDLVECTTDIHTFWGLSFGQRYYITDIDDDDNTIMICANPYTWFNQYDFKLIRRANDSTL